MNQTCTYGEEWRAQTAISDTIDAGVGEPTVVRRHRDSESSESDSSGSESEEREVPEETRKVESKQNAVREWRAGAMERTNDSTATHEESSSSCSDDEEKTNSGAQRTGAGVEFARNADRVDVDSLFTDDENSKPFYLERSITNKANCRHCRLSIAKNEWRFGRAISRRKNHPEMFKAWYHLDCIFLAYADPTRSRKSNTSMPPYLLKDPKREINDWAFVEEEQQRRFVEQLAELHRRNKREDLSPSDESSVEDDEEEDEFGHSRCDKKRSRRLRRNGGPSTPEAPSLALFGKRVVDQRLVNKCKREFAGLEGKHDSLEAFGRLRTLLASNKLNNSERLDVLQLWFHPTTFKGDLFLWFTVLINVAMKRSFHVKDKQLIKLFSTKIFHVPLGTIESRILERNNRGSCARDATAEAQSEASSGEEPVAQHLSRSVLRRINVRNLPSLLADMFSEMTNSRIKPREQSTLSLRTTWDTLVAIGGMKKEVERNRALTRLLLQCTTRDIEEILRMLLSVLDLKLNKKHIIDAFSETAYAQWEGRKHKIFKEEHFDELIKLVDWDKLHKERDQLREHEEKESAPENDLLLQLEDKLKQLHHECDETETSGLKRKLEEPTTTASTTTTSTSTTTDTSTSTSSTAASTPNTRLQPTVPPTKNSSPNLILHIPKKRRLDPSVKDGTLTPSPQHGISDGILAAALVAQRELPSTPGNIPDTQRSPFHHSVSYLLSSVNASHRSSAISPNNCTFDCTPPLNQKPNTPTPVISMFNHPTPSLLPPMIALRKPSPPLQKLP